ncbi:hypothetical protein BASA81_007037 [Batrachochytrium salamandrivorans]|nr:hypothetical protein BASA81_007037 [Batrachochytrium salamandrivorans]
MQHPHPRFIVIALVVAVTTGIFSPIYYTALAANPSVDVATSAIATDSVHPSLSLSSPMGSTDELSGTTTESSELSDPTDPSDPTESSKLSEPTESAEPTKPTKPTELEELEKPADSPEDYLYDMGVSQSWYFPVKAPLNTVFIGVEGPDLVILGNHNSFAHLNKTSSGFQMNTTLNDLESFRHFAYDYSTLITLSGELGEFVGVWDSRTGASYSRTEVTDLDDLADPQESYDVAFVRLGKLVWTFKPEDSAVRFHRLVTGNDGLILIGTRVDTTIVLVHLSFATGDKILEHTIVAPSPLIKPSSRDNFVVFGDPESRWISWHGQNGRVRLYSLSDDVQMDIPEYIYDYTKDRTIVALVELGYHSLYMGDFVVQFSSGVDVTILIFHDVDLPYVDAVFLPETSSQSIILKQTYYENNYVLSRIHVDVYNQMLLEFNDIETGSSVENKVLFPAFDGIIIKGYMFYSYDDHDKISWNVVGLDENGMFVSYDNTKVFKTTYLSEEEIAAAEEKKKSEKLPQSELMNKLDQLERDYAGVNPMPIELILDTLKSMDDVDSGSAYPVPAADEIESSVSFDGGDDIPDPDQPSDTYLPDPLLLDNIHDEL